MATLMKVNLMMMVPLMIVTLIMVVTMLLTISMIMMFTLLFMRMMMMIIAVMSICDERGLLLNSLCTFNLLFSLNIFSQMAGSHNLTASYQEFLCPKE